MFINLPYTPTHSQQWLERFFKKNFYKKPYDRFMWWRGYVPKSKPLHSRVPFRDRLLNGDFDVPSFLYEAQMVEHKMNEKWLQYGYKDNGRYHEDTSLDRARRKRLLEDHSKEEVKRLQELEKGFVSEFKMTKEQYNQEAINTTSRTLIDFYYKMQDKYGLRRIKTQNHSGFPLAGDRNF